MANGTAAPVGPTGLRSPTPPVPYGPIVPFTLAHPAAVLPLLCRPLVPTALVAGALSPDLPYFLRAADIPVGAQSWYEPLLNATTTHGFPGFLTVALPIALLLHLCLLAARAPLATVAPAREPAAGPRAGTPSSSTTVGWVAVSLVLGVLTHVLWDSFTHSDGWVVLRVPVLTNLSWEPCRGSGPCST